MPTAVELSLLVVREPSRQPTTRQLHAAVAGLVDERPEEHHQGVKPFAVWPLYSDAAAPDEVLHLRVAWLRDGPLPPNLLEEGRSVRVGSLHARVQHVSARTRTYVELSQVTPVSSVWLDFLTPTYFMRQQTAFPLPDPRLVFASLLDRWNTFAGAYAVANERRAEFLGSLAVTDFDIERQMLEVDRPRHDSAGVVRRGKTQVGFVGAVQFVVGPGTPDTARSVLSAMSSYVEFCGVGAATTQGFGACIRREDR